jgi:hypothetical protein
MRGPESFRGSQITEVNDGHRLVVGDETDGRLGTPPRIQRWHDGQFLGFAVKGIIQLRVEYALVRRRLGHTSAREDIGHAGIR